MMYYRDDEQLGHDCCWSSAVVRNYTDEEMATRRDSCPSVKIVCECLKEDADLIAAALNAFLEEKPR